MRMLSSLVLLFAAVTACANIPRQAGFYCEPNLTSDGARTFEYDDENQLVRISASGSETQFIYDAFMRRRVALEYKAATNCVQDFVTGAQSLSSVIRNDACVGRREIHRRAGAASGDGAGPLDAVGQFRGAHDPPGSATRGIPFQRARPGPPPSRGPRQNCDRHQN
jgi:YD repeat-containing protein